MLGLRSGLTKARRAYDDDATAAFDMLSWKMPFLSGLPDPFVHTTCSILAGPFRKRLLLFWTTLSARKAQGFFFMSVHSCLRFGLPFPVTRLSGEGSQSKSQVPGDQRDTLGGVSQLIHPAHGPSTTTCLHDWRSHLSTREHSFFSLPLSLHSPYLDTAVARRTTGAASK